jgi:hypothetical protein
MVKSYMSGPSRDMQSLQKEIDEMRMLLAREKS